MKFGKPECHYDSPPTSADLDPKRKTEDLGGWSCQNLDKNLQYVKMMKKNLLLIFRICISERG